MTRKTKLRAILWMIAIVSVAASVVIEIRLWELTP